MEGWCRYTVRLFSFKKTQKVCRQNLNLATLHMCIVLQSLIKWMDWIFFSTAPLFPWAHRMDGAESLNWDCIVNKLVRFRAALLFTPQVGWHIKDGLMITFLTGSYSCLCYNVSVWGWMHRLNQKFGWCHSTCLSFSGHSAWDTCGLIFRSTKPVHLLLMLVGTLAELPKQSMH